MKALLTALTLSAAPALADAPQVISAEMTRNTSFWSVSVVMSHEDSGWDHFASGFEVEMPDGTRIAHKGLTRPQTDSPRINATLGGITIPEGTPYVLIRTRCSLVGWSAEPFSLAVPD